MAETVVITKRMKVTENAEAAPSRVGRNRQAIPAAISTIRSISRAIERRANRMGPAPLYLVPTLRVGMPSARLRLVFGLGRALRRDAERQGRHSHAERGNEGGCERRYDSPRTRAWNLLSKSFVIGPGLPVPIGRASHSTTGITSAAVPVRKHSSAV